MFLGLGLGLLAKGPLTLILAGLPIGLWALLEWRWRALWRGLPWIRGSLLMLLVAAPWYLLAELKTPGFLGTSCSASIGSASSPPAGTATATAMPTPIPTAASGCSCWPPRFPGASGCRCCSGWAGASAGRWSMASPRAGATGCSGDWRRACSSPSPATSSGPTCCPACRPGVARRRPAARARWRWRLLRRGGLACLALTPLLFALFLGSLLLGSRAEQKSTAALLASDAGWRERPLVFWPKRPYSAVFYSGGRAQRAEDSELAGWLRRDALLAIRSRSFGALPDGCASACAAGRQWDGTSYAGAWRRLAETTSAGRRSSRDAGRCAGGCGRCPGGGHRWCTGGSCGRGTGGRRWPCG